MLRRIRQSFLRFLRDQSWALILCVCTAALCALVAYKLIWPAYQNPIARMYTSKLGYASVIRKTGASFPVTSAEVTRRQITGKFIGEGLTQAEPTQVPMVAMANIVKVHVVEGQRVKKGDLIIELDDSRLRMKIKSAEAAIATAKAELERVRIGTVNVLQEERPDILEVRIDQAKANIKQAEETLATNIRLNRKGARPGSLVAENRLALTQAKLELQELQLSHETANRGRVNSIEIGESAITEAELTLAYRKKQLEDYRSYAPADGIVERVLVHDGEYNQDPGRPGVLLASGLWFECYLDQTALGRVHVGDTVEVRFGAYQHRTFTGSIERIRPLVNFSLGGPETTRPIRPLGTGAPEWPATFSVRVALDPSKELIVPGLTGYATVLQQRKVLTVPRGCVNAVSGNRGIAFVISEDETSFEPRNVVVGVRDQQYVEVQEGLEAGEMVIADGQQVLEPEDRIEIVSGPTRQRDRQTPSANSDSDMRFTLNHANKE